jgi:hypothetical protein
MLGERPIKLKLSQMHVLRVNELLSCSESSSAPVLLHMGALHAYSCSTIPP